MAGYDCKQDMLGANRSAVSLASDWPNPCFMESGLVYACPISADKCLFVLLGLERQRLGFRCKVLRRFTQLAKRNCGPGSWAIRLSTSGDIVQSAAPSRYVSRSRQINLRCT